MSRNPRPYQPSKARGYGIVTIKYKNLDFGIPIRTTLHQANKFCYKTSETGGLDFQKAVIVKSGDISSEVFKINPAEFTKIQEKSVWIESRFERYVEAYISSVQKENRQAHERDFRFSTLINYHKELGISS